MKKNDRRVQRTQMALMSAMRELILEKGLEATTVSEITERANVGRSTFYAHYADKEDLLQGAVEGLKRELEDKISGVHPDPDVHPALAFCLPMLEHAHEHRAMLPAMLGKRSGHFFIELLHDVWMDLIRARWRPFDELTVQAITGAFGSVLFWWIERGADLSPLEVDKRFRALVGPLLR